MLSVGIIILIVLLSIWFLGTLYRFFTPCLYYLQTNEFPEGYSTNIFLVFFDSTLWPGDLIYLFYCPSESRPRSFAEDNLEV